MISSSGTSSKPLSVSIPFRYLIGFPLGSWIMRKAMVPSVEVAGNILTGTRTRDRRSLPDQTGKGAIGDTQQNATGPRIWGVIPLPQVNKGGPPNSGLHFSRSKIAVKEQWWPSSIDLTIGVRTPPTPV